MRKYYNLILISVFTLAFFLMIFSAKSDSQTTDEGIHLFAGYTYLTQRDFRLDPEHPPLLKELNALPLLFLNNLNVELNSYWQRAGNFYYDSWQEARILGEQFLYQNGNNPEQLLFWSRLITILLTLTLGLFSYFWAKKLYGEKAGILAAFLTLFFPNILAHGRLVNTDLGLTLFILIAVYYWGQYLKSPSWRNNWMNLAAAGLFSGLAMASKYTAIMLFVILAVIAFTKIVQDKKIIKFAVIGYISILLATFVVIWASYGFPVNEFSLTNVLPAYFMKGFQMVRGHVAGGHDSFLLGANSNTGWWYYFPVGILFKTPIPIFILLAIAIKYFKKIKAKDNFDEYVLITAPTVFLLIAMFSNANLGIRHILSIFPFLFIFIAKSINVLDFAKALRLKILFILILIWYLVSAFISYPNYIAYFNEFAGGSKNGPKILTDSNIDWGQDVLRIKNYLEINDIKNGYIVYPWNGQPALYYYDINLIPLEPGMKNIKGNVVIAATYYQTDAYRWLHQYPVKQITPGVFLVTVR